MAKNRLRKTMASLKGKKISESVKEARAGLIPSEDGYIPPQKRTIRIIMDGGLIQEIRDIPPDITIEVRDYDVEGSDVTHHNMQRDENDEWMFVNVWEQGGKTL